MKYFSGNNQGGHMHPEINFRNQANEMGDMKKKDKYVNDVL